MPQRTPTAHLGHIISRLTTGGLGGYGMVWDEAEYPYLWQRQGHGGHMLRVVNKRATADDVMEVPAHMMWLRDLHDVAEGPACCDGGTSLLHTSSPRVGTNAWGRCRVMGRGRDKSWMSPIKHGCHPWGRRHACCTPHLHAACSCYRPRALEQASCLPFVPAVCHTQLRGR